MADAQRGPSSPFVGRVEELAALDDALDAAAEGTLVATFISGERGSGKTALARAFVERVRRRGIPVHWGTCTEIGGGPAFWPWIQILRSFGPDVLDGAQAALADHADEPFAAYHVVEQVLRNQVAGPCVLVLDDLEVADHPSLDLLRFLTTAGQDLPLLVVGIHRSGAVRHDSALDALVVDVAGFGRRLTARPLDVNEVRALLGPSSPGEPDVAPDVLARTGGNAFYVEQLAEALRRGGPDALAELPDGVRAAVRTRLAPLPDETRALLAHASVLVPLRLPVLAAMVGQAPADVRHTLGPAIAAGILSDGDPDLTFTHALVAEAVAVDVGPLARAAAHLAAAEAWSSGSGSTRPAAVIAQHLVSAGPIADVGEVGRWTSSAAEAALELGAHAEAARWYEEAARRWAETGDVEREGEALIGAIGAHSTLGDGGQALVLSDRLARLARKIDSGRLLAQAALARAEVFDPARPVDVPPLIQEALHHPDLAGDRAVRADLLLALASLLGMPSIDGVRHDGEGARQAVAELADLAASGDRHLRARLAEARLHVESGPAHAERRKAWLAELNQAAPAGASLRDRLERAYWATSLALEGGDLREAARHVRAWERLAERSEASYWRWRCQMARSSIDYGRGRFVEAEQRATQAFPLMADLHPDMGYRVLSGLVFAIRRDQGRLHELEDLPAASFGVLAAVVAAQRGDHDEARRHLHQVVAMAEATGPDDLYWLCLVSVVAAAASIIGDEERCRWAAELLTPHLGQVIMWGRSYVFGPPVGEVLGAARWGAGDRAGAAEAFRHALRWAEGAGAPGFAARAGLGLALALDPGDPERERVVAEARAAAVALGQRLVLDALDELAPGPDPAPAGVPAPGPRTVARVRTLGRFEVVGVGQEEPSRWSSRKARDALKFLISRRGRAVPREELIEALWPEVDLATARTRLSVVLSMVRTALDPDKRFPTDPLRADRQAVALDLDLVEVDVETFLAEAARAHSQLEVGHPDARTTVARALTAGEGGDFLAEDPYVDWAGPLRAAVARTRRTLRRDQARAAAAQGAIEDAVAAWTRLVDDDPDDGEAIAELCRLLEAAGRRSEAAEVRQAASGRQRALGLAD